jgi:hypothetical protein
MSTQTLEQSAAQVTELDAEAVKKVLAALPPVRAERDYHITIELLEHGGTSHIRWWLDLNYAVRVAGRAQALKDADHRAEWRLRAPLNAP